jgi:hypothetical protein
LIILLEERENTGIRTKANFKYVKHMETLGYLPYRPGHTCLKLHCSIEAILEILESVYDRSIVPSCGIIVS